MKYKIPQFAARIFGMTSTNQPVILRRNFFAQTRKVGMTAIFQQCRLIIVYSEKEYPRARPVIGYGLTVIPRVERIKIPRVRSG